MEMHPLGKALVIVGVVIVGVGLLMMFSDRIPFLGKLPGDISIKRGNFQLHIPITTSIVLTVLVNLLLWIVFHFKGK